MNNLQKTINYREFSLTNRSHSFSFKFGVIPILRIFMSFFSQLFLLTFLQRNV